MSSLAEVVFDPRSSRVVLGLVSHDPVQDGLVDKVLGVAGQEVEEQELAKLHRRQLLLVGAIRTEVFAYLFGKKNMCSLDY